MTSEKSPSEQLKGRSDDEIISDNLCVITTYFSDIFDKYSFFLKEKTIEQIIFSNSDFEIVFGYERNRYGIVEFNGVMIGVKHSGKRYALNYIVDVFSDKAGETFDRKFGSLVNMSGEERCRTLWDGYVDKTFEDAIPKWEKEVHELLRQRFPNFF
jgi:hypothetical protein